VLAGVCARGQDGTFNTGTTLVTVPANVVDARGHPVWGLTAADFAVYDNGRPQVVKLEDVEHPRSRALVILVEEDNDALMLKASLDRGLVDFIEGLPATPARIAIMTVGTEPTLLLPFTADRDLAINTLKVLQPAGSPAPPSLTLGRGSPVLVDALFKAAQLFSPTEAESDKSILLVSLSKDRGSVHRIDETLSVIEARNITVHAIEYSSVERGLRAWWSDPELAGLALNLNTLLNHAAGWLQQDVPRHFAMASGGLVQFAGRKGGVSVAALAIDAQLPAQYSLSFHPSDRTPGLHSLRVVLPRQPGLAIRNRVFYWMQAGSLLRGPVGMAGEETAEKTQLVDEKEAEANAHHP
jgi:VWFA-related protein